MNAVASTFRVSSESAIERELLDRARALQPWLAEHAAETEANGRVSEETTRKLVEADLYRLAQPKRFGGYELPPSSSFRLGFEIARACPSTAWCAIIANSMQWLVSYWPEEAQQDVWGDNPRNVIAGTFSPTAACETADGGYRVTGKWPFSSNSDNSDWLFVSSWFPQDSVHKGAAGWFLVPSDTVSVDHDSWKVAGMQGSGSKTLYSEAPLSIPEHRALAVMDIMTDATPGRDIPDNIEALYNFSTFGCIYLAAPVMGGAQGAIDWFTGAMRDKVKVSMKPGAKATAAENPEAQQRAGEAQARLDAAVALLLTDIKPLEDKVAAGEMLTVDERIRVRRAAGFAAQQGRAIVNMLMESAGASAAYMDVPMQRFFRDINIGANHTTLDVGGINRMAGQQMFGMEPVGAY